MAKQTKKRAARKKPAAKKEALERGRPPVFTTAAQMEKAVDQYFTDCGESKVPPTICGLAVALGFASRQSLMDYSKRPDFSDTVKRAKLRVEQRLEENLHQSGAAGSIFNLKCNFGWKEDANVNVTLSGKDGGPIETVDRTPIEIAQRLVYILNSHLPPQGGEGEPDK